MSDEEEFDAEKTQMWLPGQPMPGRPTEGDAAGDKEGIRLGRAAPPAAETAPRAAGAEGDDNSIDFDVTAEAPGGGGGIDFDVTAEEEANSASLDFDITGEDAIEPVAARSAAPVVPPPLAAADTSSPSGGARLLIVIVAIAGIAFYLMTR